MDALCAVCAMTTAIRQHLLEGPTHARVCIASGALFELGEFPGAAMQVAALRSAFAQACEGLPGTEEAGRRAAARVSVTGETEDVVRLLCAALVEEAAALADADTPLLPVSVQPLFTRVATSRSLAAKPARRLKALQEAIEEEEWQNAATREACTLVLRLVGDLVAAVASIGGSTAADAFRDSVAMALTPAMFGTRAPHAIRKAESHCNALVVLLTFQELWAGASGQSVALTAKETAPQGKQTKEATTVPLRRTRSTSPVPGVTEMGQGQDLVLALNANDADAMDARAAALAKASHATAMVRFLDTVSSATAGVSLAEAVSRDAPTVVHDLSTVDLVAFTRLFLGHRLLVPLAVTFGAAGFEDAQRYAAAVEEALVVADTVRVAHATAHNLSGLEREADALPLGDTPLFGMWLQGVASWGVEYARNQSDLIPASILRGQVADYQHPLAVTPETPHHASLMWRLLLAHLPAAIGPFLDDVWGTTRARIASALAADPNFAATDAGQGRGSAEVARGQAAFVSLVEELLLALTGGIRSGRLPAVVLGVLQTLHTRTHARYPAVCDALIAHVLLVWTIGKHVQDTTGTPGHEVMVRVVDILRYVALALCLGGGDAACPIPDLADLVHGEWRDMVFDVVSAVTSADPAQSPHVSADSDADTDATEHALRQRLLRLLRLTLAEAKTIARERKLLLDDANRPSGHLYRGDRAALEAWKRERRNERAGSGSSDEEGAGTREYGVSLEDIASRYAARDADPLPRAVLACTEFLRQADRIATPELFELPVVFLVGSIARIKTMIDVDRIVWTAETDPHAVGGALGAFFRELPDPLFPRNLSERVFAKIAAHVRGDIDTLSLLTSLRAMVHNNVTGWTEAHRQVLRYMSRFLGDVYARTESNGVSLPVLARHFGLLWTRTVTTSSGISPFNASARWVALLVTQPSWFWEGEPDNPGPIDQIALDDYLGLVFED